MADLDDGGIGAQKTGDLRNRLHRGRKADTLRLRPSTLEDETIEPLERDGEMRATFVVGKSVDLVDDHRFHRPQELTALGRGEEDEKRLRGGHEDMGRRPEHPLPLGRRRISGADGGSDGSEGEPSLDRPRPDRVERVLEVLADVVRKRPERGNVERFHLFRKRPAARELEQPVDGEREGGESLPRPRGSGDQNVSAGTNDWPAAPLRLGGLRESRLEPIGQKGMEAVEHGPIVANVGPRGNRASPIVAGGVSIAQNVRSVARRTRRETTVFIFLPRAAGDRTSACGT